MKLNTLGSQDPKIFLDFNTRFNEQRIHYYPLSGLDDTCLCRQEEISALVYSTQLGHRNPFLIQFIIDMAT